MLSYRHGYHAGNPADLLKHAVLIQLIKALQRKEKGFCYFDTHAGAGDYDLTSGFGQQQQEHCRGIEFLQQRAQHIQHPALKDYLALVTRYNQQRVQAKAPGIEADSAAEGHDHSDSDGNGATSGLRFYPGSPAIAQHLQRPQDSLLLCDLHPQEPKSLKRLFKNCPQVAIHQRNGYEAMRALLPPKEKRALVLIDPSYENKNEDIELSQALHASLKRFPQGVYAIWYPLIEQRNVVATVKGQSWFRQCESLDLRFNFPESAQLGRMKASGMLVVNPPWHARPQLEGLGEALVEIYS